MLVASLEDKIRTFGDPVTMLRSPSHGTYIFPIQAQFTNWRDEQESWAETAVIFDQSHHMVDIYFKGPDVKRLFSEVGVNSFKNFGRNKAKQFVAVNYDGDYIGDAICFGFEDDEYSIVGPPIVPNWLEYHAKTGGYDVEITRDERTELNSFGRLTFRYQIQGPKALEIITRAAGGTMPDIKFFNMGEFTIAGYPVRALNHTMSGVPGVEKTGLEIVGAASGAEAVAAAIIEAGKDSGLRQGGALAYPTTCLESGWVGLPVPAIYSGDAMRPYREYLSADGLEANAGLGGSFYSANIADHYYSPWDLGVGRTIKFDHDFIGRDALERKAKESHKKKVRLEWNDDEVLKVIGKSLFNTTEKRAKYLDMPLSVYSTYKVDRVTVGGELVGLSEYTGYLSTARKFLSIALLDEAHAVDGNEVTVVWGDHGDTNSTLEKHALTEVRAIVDTKAYSA
jgi:vanillate/3-O-methylgallate O-demethylase